MTAYIIMGLIIIIFGIIIFITIKSKSELKKCFIEEQERAAAYKVAMLANVNLAKKAAEIDIKVEEKKRARKKMSKKDKILAGNNRGNND